MDADQPDVEAPSKNAKKYDEFLSLPTPQELSLFESQENYTPPFIRAHSSHLSTSERFELRKKTFERQYADIYAQRLAQLRPILTKQAQKKWKGHKVLKAISDISNLQEGQECVFVGTLVKEMPLVKRVLDEFTKEKGIAAVPPKHFVSSKDTALLEDEEGRILLTGDKFHVEQVVTGMIIAVKGNNVQGTLEVIDICYAGLPETDKLDFEADGTPLYVALVSGLQIGHPEQDVLALELFSDFITGNSGSKEEQKLASNIVRLVIAGNALAAPEALPPGQKLTSMRKDNVSPLQELDALLTQISSVMPLDILPGENDPTHFVMPQPPFARCLLPRSYMNSTFKSVTNPCEFEQGGRVFLGTSGQTLTNIERYMEVKDMLALAEQTLNWQHVAPTAPDQLACYPFLDQDPFVIKRCPNVYFIGNQKEFATKLIHGPDGQVVRIILLPAFAENPTAVLVNLHDLNVHPITFNTAM
eukprot:TRINITY_DN8203_c0_g1_i1.p1 TRINITY_DN8203_c0_g1~~TRINITY_DN8203_c0_g1_i1.p1  ORF type:complete len:487 (+),score=81.70 TRINITY_DN8203_c0_g1_i1:44-1462(+)